MIQLPEQFEVRMRKMLGEEEFREFLAAYGKPRHPGLRLNPLKLPEPFAWKLMGPFHLRPVPWAEPYGFYYTEGMRDAERPGKSPLHEAGLYYIQEPSAMAVAAMSGVTPGEKVLDLCAAPGGKSTQIAGMLQGKGLLVSNEINSGRAEILSRNIERMGIRNAVVTNESSGRLAERFGAYFDRVIVDAPCSGEGMFRREEQALAMWSPENVAMCAERQSGILDDAAAMVKSGGTLVYSTCTFSPEEDEGSVSGFLVRHPEFSLVNLPEEIGEKRMRAWGMESGSVSQTIRLWPHRLDGEGHFVAVLRKSGEYVPEEISEGEGLASAGRPVHGQGKCRKRTGKGTGGRSCSVQDPLSALSGFMDRNVAAAVVDNLAARAGSSAAFYGNRLYLVPYAARLPLEGLRVLRPGLELGIPAKGRFEPSHSLAMALRPSEVLQSADYSVDSREAAAFLHGESVPCDSSLKGWTLVTVEGVSMGWGKASDGVLKNHYPKGLRRPYV